MDRTWDNIKEDAAGGLSSAVAQMLDRSRRKRVNATPMQRGVIRHLLILLDLSLAMQDIDLRPTRILLTVEYLKHFISAFFEQNPIGQLGIIGMKNGLAEWISRMSNHPQEICTRLGDKVKMELSGEPSLQNALDMARGSMSHLPTHGSKELLVLFGSLTTCDPGNIHDTIKKMISDNIKINVIGLAAELKILKDISSMTGGSLSIVLNEEHYKTVLSEIIPPQVIQKTAAQMLNRHATSSASDLMLMGFPKKKFKSISTLCACHSKLKTEGFVCPRCLSQLCDVPTDCDVCGLVVVASAHLARSYHHLFPVKEFQGIHGTESTGKCKGCEKVLTKAIETRLTPTAEDMINGQYHAHDRFICPTCKSEFCSECDVYIHDVLHVCPGCEL